MLEGQGCGGGMGGHGDGSWGVGGKDKQQLLEEEWSSCV